MAVRRLALLSLGLNLCLLAWLAFGFESHRAVPPPPSVVKPSPVTAARTNHPSSPAAVPVPLRWSDVASTNLLVYAANLRSIGCPEALLQKVIVTEIDRDFESRWARRPRETNYWRTGGEQFKQRRVSRQSKARLESERRAQIREVLGVEFHELTYRSWEPDDIGMATYLFGSLLSSEAEIPRARLRKFFDSLRDNGAFGDRIQTPEENMEWQASRKQMVSDLAAALSPADLEEAELRVMNAKVLDVWSLPAQFGNEFTIEEYRAFLRIKKRGFNALGLLLDDDDHPPNNENIKQEQDLQIRALLGQTRYQGYERAQDFSFRQLHRALDEFDQPIETVWHVYDLQRDAATAVERLRQNSELTPDQQASALAAIQRDTQTALAQAMGSPLADKYLQRYGNWIKQLGQPKR